MALTVLLCSWERSICQLIEQQHVQLFDSVAEVQHPGSPGSKPMLSYDPMRMARETAEQQAEAINPRAKRKSGLSVTIDSSAKCDDSDREQVMSESLRQLSVASCASEWVDSRPALPSKDPA